MKLPAGVILAFAASATSCGGATTSSTAEQGTVAGAGGKADNGRTAESTAGFSGSGPGGATSAGAGAGGVGTGGSSGGTPPDDWDGCLPGRRMVNGACKMRELYFAGGSFVMGRGYCPASQWERTHTMARAHWPTSRMSSR
jgi:hypothetical protein